MEDLSILNDAGVGEAPGHPNDHNLPMRVEMVPTAKLTADPESARQFSRRDFKAARRVIRRFGVRTPLVIDADNRVLVGEIILHVARELAIDALPVVRVDHLERLECQALAVAYARLGELGEFDKDALSGLMLRFEVELPGFELGISGSTPRQST